MRVPAGLSKETKEAVTSVDQGKIAKETEKEARRILEEHRTINPPRVASELLGSRDSPEGL